MNPPFRQPELPEYWSFFELLSFRESPKLYSFVYTTHTHTYNSPTVALKQREYLRPNKKCENECDFINQKVSLYNITSFLFTVHVIISLRKKTDKERESRLCNTKFVFSKKASVPCLSLRSMVQSSTLYTHTLHLVYFAKTIPSRQQQQQRRAQNGSITWARKPCSRGQPFEAKIISCNLE